MVKNFSSSVLLCAGIFALAACASPEGKFGNSATPEDLIPEADNASLEKFLAAQKYSDALELALREKIFGVANYIAEYVMETDELFAFVREKFPDAPADGVPDESADGTILESSDDAANEVRYALARRLMRENRPQVAREFFPPELAHVFEKYAEAMRRGYDYDSADAARARGFWDAAMIVRADGDALFSLFSVPEYVAEKNFYSDDERARVASRGFADPVVALRSRAAKLAEYAANLLPNNDERTARILFTAGVWLRARSPEDADDFYKMLAIRCPKTKVGRRCIELRWFPSEVPWTREQVWDGVPEDDFSASASATPEADPGE